ncbi:MAG: 3-isopropylmalate dehydrogenase, partial [Rhizobiales bacterium]|nr:3-isopropylmalate dehydrogenase [Hyphomicrobiales bacterium]
IILFDKAFWQSAVDLEHLADAGMIHRDDLRLFSYADSAEAVWDSLLAHGLHIPA